jgi:hypothetical protein
MDDYKIELVPDAHLLLSSLRSVGYNVETAIADIVDNCIAAHSTQIHIDFTWDDDASRIAIYDNGAGMDKDILIASMKIGSADPSDKRDNDDLGRFGMGMKTAAFSMGKRLRVVTKQGQDSVTTACWDLDYIEKQHDGKWNLLIDDVSVDTIYQEYPAYNASDCGTMILVDLLDRFVDNTALKKSKTNFYKIVERVKAHVGMIFHRFIEEDGLQIFFKDDVIPAWNPFIPTNNATQELSEEEYFDGEKYVLVQPYVLPHKTKFSSPEEFKAAEGPKGWTAQQGIYVYRNRRLLVYGTWFDFRRKELAFNLARIRLDMNADQDYDWKIDIKKSVATPPLYMREILDRAITVCTAQSAKVYNSRGAYSKNPGSQQLSYVWEQRKNRHGAYMFYLNKKHPMLNKVFQQLDEDGKADLKAYLALIEGYAPSVQSGLTAYMSESDKVIVADDDPAKLADIVEAKNYIRRFLSNGFAKEEVKEIILGMPNYKYIENELMKVFEEENYD